ncbi:MAG: Nramp family divalent metal transporter [Nitrospirae bacterium]|nr:Nramp family divalent metal transporter [Nitrospirota bacterium]MEC4688078.1 Nramp family divalent metal transporter [Nitrospirota bacterium]
MTKGVWQALGPGLVFAAAAVGVSHLVQSTRAGAVYGFSLVGVVILANIIKYPAFRFGPQYAAATGTSLLEGYRRQGKWALVLYSFITVATMFIVQAAVTVVTAGLAIATLGLSVGPLVVSFGIIVVCAILLTAGKYRLLDRVTKVLVALLTGATLTATALAFTSMEWSASSLVELPDLDKRTVFFVVALVGWMPSAIDVAVWQSLWTLARREDSQHAPTLKESMFDFHLGYIGTAALALCFLTMGAGVMHGRGVKFADSAGGFAAQVIRLYTETLGEWSGPIIGVAAFAVMFSTTLTVLDGFPRALTTLMARFKGPEEAGVFELKQKSQGRTYWAMLLLLAVGAMLVLFAFLTSLKAMVDVATTLSFLTAPILSVLNHRAVLGAEVPTESRPRPWLIWMSILGIVCQGSFAAYYVYLRYFT